MKKTIKIKTVKQSSKELFDLGVNELLSEGFEIHSTGYEDGSFIAIMEFREEQEEPKVEEYEHKDFHTLHKEYVESLKVVPAKYFERGDVIQKMIDEDKIVSNDDYVKSFDPADAATATEKLREAVKSSGITAEADNPFFGVDFGTYGHMIKGQQEEGRIFNLSEVVTEKAKRAGLLVAGLGFVPLIKSMLHEGNDFEQIEETFNIALKVFSDMNSEGTLTPLLEKEREEIYAHSPIGKIGDEINLSDEQIQGFKKYFEQGANIQPVRPEQNNDELFIGPASGKIGVHKKNKTSFFDLFNYFSNQHELTLTDTELSDIIDKVIPVIINREDFARSFCFQLEKQNFKVLDFIKIAEGEQPGRFNSVLDDDFFTNTKKQIVINQEELKAFCKENNISFEEITKKYELQHNPNTNNDIMFVDLKRLGYEVNEERTSNIITVNQDALKKYCEERNLPFDKVNSRLDDMNKPDSTFVYDFFGIESIYDDVFFLKPKKGTYKCTSDKGKKKQLKILPVAQTWYKENKVDFFGVIDTHKLSDFLPVDPFTDVKAIKKTVSVSTPVLTIKKGEVKTVSSTGLGEKVTFKNTRGVWDLFDFIPFYPESYELAEGNNILTHTDTTGNEGSGSNIDEVDVSQNYIEKNPVQEKDGYQLLDEDVHDADVGLSEEE